MLEDEIKKTIKRQKSILLLGPRQTGKSTLIKRLESNLFISLTDPKTRQRYEKNPELLDGEIKTFTATKKIKLPLIVIDEVQKVPVLLDVAQEIIDNHEGIFIFTGSSARKLRRESNVNLLPGRVISLRLDPLIISEIKSKELLDILMYGSLPGIVNLPQSKLKEEELESYVTTYLEEEVRSEAIVRNLGPFGRFLELAASESGSIINLRKLSQEIGVSHTTIASYFQILEDCLIIERIEPITKSKTRKKLTKAEKYLFFDLGVRRVAAREGIQQPRERLGMLFEQFIGLELIRCSRMKSRKFKLRFWRDPDGPEVDWIIDNGDSYVPIETKWTDSPTKSDIKHLKVFLDEYKNSKAGYLICQTPRKVMLDKNIFAMPWQDANSLITSE
ncbi:MAG: hypothetical protein A3I68_01525 [Candidatus Melainabacteria bacterium RIFCSPLOWO2_02_FULL_35_15]|nr:MAG: hypothetical protein A3F80_04835 [Candidatus Melainabacteria bacterium RIFCSPLOWO2_12_FULL_35_11]OGI12991.1 MAG: hypothetical protein A3I68_01525 [Candidatus Melainabacteria bacterium RIFCSPLOWO2_02_FULL_35_15]